MNAPLGGMEAGGNLRGHRVWKDFGLLCCRWDGCRNVLRFWSYGDIPGLSLLLFLTLVGYLLAMFAGCG